MIHYGLAMSLGPDASSVNGVAARASAAESPAGLPAGSDWLTVKMRTLEADPGSRQPVMPWVGGGAWLFGPPTIRPGVSGSAVVRFRRLRRSIRSNWCTRTWAALANGGALGACHGLDVPVTFGAYGGLDALLTGSVPSPETEALSARFRSAWTAFAATGDPGRPAYGPERRLVQLLGAEPTVTAHFVEAARRLGEHRAALLLATA